MAWRWPAQIIETGVVVDPRDFVRNQMEFVGEFNGKLDRDNVGLDEVASSDLATQALVSAGSNPQSGSPLQTIPAGQAGEWTDVTTLQTSVTTDDGEIIVDSDLNMVWTPAAVINDKWEARTLVNGSVIASTGWTHLIRTASTRSMTGSSPVMKGTTTIQVQVRAWSDPWTGLSTITNGTATNSIRTLNTGYTLGTLYVYAGNVVWVHRKR